MKQRMVGMVLAWCMTLGVSAVTHQAVAAERSATKNYILRCLGCHGADGSGAPKQGIPAFPGLVDPLYSNDKGRTYLVHVPGVTASSLTNNEIAEVLNYVADRWAKAPEQLQRFTAQEVQERQQVPVKDVVALRRALTEQLRQQGIELADYPWP